MLVAPLQVHTDFLRAFATLDVDREERVAAEDKYSRVKSERKLMNELVDEVEGAAALHEDEFVLDQSRQPKKGDIVTFVYGESWVIGKILSKAKSSNYYNVELQNSAKVGVYFRPPTPEYEESWSLLSEDQWQPDQLRETFSVIGSKESSPIMNVVRDSNPPTPHSLHLMPEETIHQGQVYVIPQTVVVEQHNQVLRFEIDQEDFDRRYQ